MTEEFLLLEILSTYDAKGPGTGVWRSETGFRI